MLVVELCCKMKLKKKEKPNRSEAASHSSFQHVEKKHLWFNNNIESAVILSSTVT